MDDKNKARTRRLIELGGLVSISGLDKLDKNEFLGLLMVYRGAYENMTDKERAVLIAEGNYVLKKRKEERLKYRKDNS